MDRSPKSCISKSTKTLRLAAAFAIDEFRHENLSSQKKCQQPVQHLSASDLRLLFQWPRNLTKNLPSESARKNCNVLEFDERHRRALVQGAIDALKHVTAAMCPADPDGLFDLVRRRLAPPPPRPPDSDNAMLLRTATSCMLGLRRGTVEGRTIRALLRGTFSPGAIEKSISGPLPCTKRTFYNADEDYQRLSRGETLVLRRHSRQRFEKDTADTLLRFTFQRENVALLSWGTHTVRLSEHDVYRLPSLTLKKLPLNIFKSYRTYCEQQSIPTISKASFLRMINTIANGNDRILSCVDYVTGKKTAMRFRSVIETKFYFLRQFGE